MGGGRIVPSLPSSLILFSDFMSRRFGQVQGCILLGQWGLARRLRGHGVGVEMGARVPRLGRGWGDGGGW